MKRSKREKYLLYVMIFNFLLTIGLCLNVLVAFNNDCKMPIKEVYLESYDDMHYTFENKAETPYWYLSDIFKVGLPKNKILIFSIGDALIVGGIIFVSFFWIKYLIKVREDKKSDKEMC